MKGRKVQSRTRYAHERSERKDENKMRYKMTHGTITASG